ncbi:hypothetical protein [Halorhabdus rudnickae]|uniref:hypothetical protein n=1 Tax=Halorhabdus rudnickae TaxID=1775544 RepID=UPI001083D926|nr:hypothetical protein [Halorhabdus rudnickae]
MPDLTRRRALLAVASGAAALAGCGGSGDERATIDDRSDRDPIDDYEVTSVRNEDGAVLFTEGDPPTATDTDVPIRYRRRGRSVIVSSDALDGITFADVPEAERLRTFASATDFETASLYLSSQTVDACHEIRLRSVTVEWDGSTDIHPHTQFCQGTRPADVACSTDTVHTVGFAIRLPVAADSSSGSGSGMSSQCRPGPSSRQGSFDADVTPAGGGEDA